MPVQIDLQPRFDDVSVAAVRGRLDLVAANVFRTKIREIVEAGSHRLVVDLAEVPFVDSSGLGALVAGLKATRQAGGDLRICNANEQVRLVLDLTSLDRVLRLFASADDAVASF